MPPKAGRTGPPLTLMAAACAVALIVAIALFGPASRTFRPGHSSYTVERPLGTYFLWKRLGVHGRTVVYFGRRPGLDESYDKAQRAAFFDALDSGRERDVVSDRNFLLAALYTGMVRKVYHVVPDGDWLEVSRSWLTSVGTVQPGTIGIPERGTIRVPFDGTPLVQARQRSLPELGERVLVYVDGAEAGSYDRRLIASLASDPNRCDVSVVSGAATLAGP